MFGASRKAKPRNDAYFIKLIGGYMPIDRIELHKYFNSEQRKSLRDAKELSIDAAVKKFEELTKEKNKNRNPYGCQCASCNMT